MIYDIKKLKEKYGNYSNEYQKILIDVKNEKLIKLKRGLYTDSKNENVFFVANNLFSPSYISFETALSFYDLIPERVYEISSATFGKNKTKEYTNDLGRFYYHDISKDAYPYAVNRIELNGVSYFIASKEKALLDTISLISPRKSMKEVKELLFEDLRINEMIFDTLDKKKMIELCDLYHNTTLKYMKKYLEKMVGNND